MPQCKYSGNRNYSRRLCLIYHSRSTVQITVQWNVNNHTHVEVATKFSFPNAATAKGEADRLTSIPMKGCSCSNASSFDWFPDVTWSVNALIRSVITSVL